LIFNVWSSEWNLFGVHAGILNIEFPTCSELLVLLHRISDMNSQMRNQILIILQKYTVAPSRPFLIDEEVSICVLVSSQSRTLAPELKD
jgi:hypothetical protein